MDESHLPETARTYPQSPDAEQGVICSFLLAPDEIGAACVERRITSEIISDTGRALIFECLMSMHIEREPIDLVTLTQKLRDWGDLDKCGGAAELTRLSNYVGTAANCGAYIGILEKKFTLRKIAQCGERYASQAYDTTAEATPLLDAFESDVLKISRARYLGDQDQCTAQQLAMIGIQEIERRIALNGQISGLSTGFAQLDVRTDGLHEQEFIAIAGKSGSGKSALAMQIVEHLAIEQRVPCAVFPLEMGRKQLSQRMIFSRARVNPARWRGPFGHAPTDLEQARLVTASGEIGRAPLFVQDSTDCTIQSVRAIMRRLVTKHRVRVVVIDSLSAMHSDTRQGRDNRVREAAECSEGCKEMAKELGLTVILVCHIGKDIERNERPNPSHLRESGKVELDADSLWFLYEPEFDEEHPTSEPEIEVYIPKQRDGEPFVRTRLVFQKYWTRFKEAEDAPESEPQQQQGLGI